MCDNSLTNEQKFKIWIAALGFGTLIGIIALVAMSEIAANKAKVEAIKSVQKEVAK